MVIVRLVAAGSQPGLATITLLAWGAAEVALRLRLAFKPGWRERLHAWSVGPGGKLREWTFFLLVVAIGGAVVGAMWLSRLTRFAIGGASVITIVGEAAAVAGIALRVWAILTLDRFFTFVVGIVPGQRVVQHGPYRMLRHPGYAGALLTLLGVGIVMANWLSLLVLVLVPTLVLGIRITVEEAALAGALGAEYKAYSGRTARLIPGVW